MKITLTGLARTELEPVKIGEEEFDVEIGVPSMEAQMIDSEMISLGKKTDGRWAAHRLRSTLVSWHRLEDADGQPIPFSFDNLAALCQQYPEVYPQIMRLAHRAFDGLTKADKKN